MILILPGEPEEYMIVFRDDGVGCEVPGGMGSIYDVYCRFLGLSCPAVEVNVGKQSVLANSDIKGIKGVYRKPNKKWHCSLQHIRMVAQIIMVRRLNSLSITISSSRAVLTSPITLSLFMALLLMSEFRTVDPMLIKELVSASIDTGSRLQAHGCLKSNFMKNILFSAFYSLFLLFCPFCPFSPF
jgi:hypothetical protein